MKEKKYEGIYMDTLIRQAVMRGLRALGKREARKKKRLTKIEKKERMDDYIDQVLKKHPEMLKKKLDREVDRRIREKMALVEREAASAPSTKTEALAMKAVKELEKFDIKNDDDYQNFVKPYKIGKDKILADDDEAELIDYVSKLNQLASKNPLWGTPDVKKKGKGKSSP